jgi:hypothetical protein
LELEQFLVSLKMDTSNPAVLYERFMFIQNYVRIDDNYPVIYVNDPWLPEFEELVVVHKTDIQT